MRGADLGTDGVGTARGTGDAAWCSGSSGPVLETALDQGDTDEHDRGAGYERREDTLQDRGLGE